MAEYGVALFAGDGDAGPFAVGGVEMCEVEFGKAEDADELEGANECLVGREIWVVEVFGGGVEEWEEDCRDAEFFA